MRKLLLFLCVVCTLPAAAQFKVRFELGNLPTDTDITTIFMAGSVNGWKPRDSAYWIMSGPEGPSLLDLNLPAGKISFKITRGSWETVETTASGDDIENRTITVRSDTTIILHVAGWKDRFKSKPKVSTALRQVRVLTDSFAMPQLGRQRRIWIYLPKNYARIDRHYPVLYMHDGQNLFDEATAGFGEWGVDEAMDSLERKFGGVIVVGIDHGGSKRINEYSPYDMERFGKGEGRAYTDFLVQTLKPYIDKNFRTRSDRANTWVAGSSMGGLISMYAHLRYPGVFGGSGVFSPAFWVAPDLRKDVLRHGSALRGKVYFYAGEQESESMVPDMLKIFQLLHQLTKAPMQTVVRAEGKHNEAAWRKEFPLFIEFMMKKEPKAFTPKF